jgi:serine phosphatase RsbU (regulator of sigma subunit)
MSVNLLARIPLFANLQSEELDLIASVLDVVNLKSGDVLFREGDVSEHFFVVSSGVLEVLTGLDTDGELLLRVVSEGGYFGELGLIVSEGRRTASIRARGDVVLLSLSRKQFIEVLQRHPLLAYAIIKDIGSWLVESGIAVQRDITEKNRQLRQALIERELLEQELKVAAEIQISILPDVLPAHDHFDFGGRILPARQVGGDFYDVFDLGNNKFGVLIGDVADKGIPSAIFMARTHALIIAEADSMVPPGEVLRKVNRHLTHLEKSAQFVTALYGVLDTETGAFSYARAGNEPPLLLYPHGEVQRLQHKPGMALGLVQDITLDEYTLFLPKGSLLVMFTDGMTDCRNPAGEQFGLERIKQTMAELETASAQSGCDQLLETLRNYQNGSRQDDDVALIAVHVK